MKRRTTCVVGAIVPLVVAGLLIAAPAAQADVATISNTTAIPVADKPCAGMAVCDSGKGNPYPSTISVSGLAGTITKVTVTLNSVTHSFPDDLDVLLVGPAGQNLFLVSDAGGGTDATNLSVTFDDAAAGTLPDVTGTGWFSPTKPVDYDTAGALDPMPAPAPALSGATTLATFNGTNPNGTWSLYVTDDGLGDTGTIGGGWSITITTNASATPTTTTVSSSPNPSRTGNNVTFTATVTTSGGTNVGANGSVTFKRGATTLSGPTNLNAAGQASFTTNTLTEGSHTVTAEYSGTALLSISSGNVVQVVDNDTVVTGNQFCNPGAITIPDNPLIPTPYPSRIFVSGLPGNVTKVTATLRGLSQGFPDDLDILLVGPMGQNLVLVSDAGGAAPITNVTTTFDDAAASSTADTSSWLTSTKPVDYDPLAAVDSFPGAPTPSTATTLATFNGTAPNGTWRLYVVDDSLGSNTGSIANGWCLTITAPDVTPPSVTVSHAGQVDPTSASTINFTATFSETVTGFEGADVLFTGSTSAGLLASVSGSGTDYTIAVTGMNRSGTVVVTIPAGSAVDGALNGNTVSTSSDNSVLFRSRQSLPGVVTGSVNWKLRDTFTSGASTVNFTFGTTPLVPIVGDWDGNGTKTSGTFERGVFKLRNSNVDGSPVESVTFGDARGFPVVGDWNNDGIDDLAVFRAGVWETRITGSGATSTFSFGPVASWPTVVPVAGDWNGDGTDGIGVYNLSGGGTVGEWNLRQTATSGSAELTFSFGGAGLYPVVGDWNADGTDGIGTKVMAGTAWSLRNTAAAGAQELSLTYGAANDLPVVWRN